MQALEPSRPGLPLVDPLGMQDSCNHESDADDSRMSAVFYKDSKGAWRTRWKPGDEPDYPFPRASGGMISTAGDYAAFCQMYLDGGSHGGKKILSKASVAAATTSQTKHLYTEEEQRVLKQTYGLGWFVSRDGVYSHGGSDGTHAWIDPNKKIVGIVFTQSTRGSQNPRRQFQRVVDAACYDPAPRQGSGR